MVMPPTQAPMPAHSDDIKALLTSLQWKEDMTIVNHDGEAVWLKPHLDAKGVRIGITDCCYVESPCERHAKMGA